MKRLLVLTTMFALLAVGLVYALPSLPNLPPKAEISPVINNGVLEVPPPAVIPPFPDLPESQLSSVTFIRFAAEFFGKEKYCNENGICEPELGERGFCSDCKGEQEPEPTPCYDFLYKSKPRWNWPENYYYSDEGLGIVSGWATGVWDAATSATIFGSAVSESYPWGIYDYYNSVSYYDYDDSGMCPTPDPCVLGVTRIWYRGNKIYEYDIALDTDFFPNGDEPHLDTVVLHEFGHATGLNDLYDSLCSDEVMYWLYEGEKTILGSGDIAGIQTLYGA